MVTFAVMMLVVVGVVYYFPSYPEAFSEISIGMSREDVVTLLTQEGFVRSTNESLVELWQRTTHFGTWSISYTLTKNKVNSVYACFRRGDQTIRARSKDRRGISSDTTAY